MTDITAKPETTTFADLGIPQDLITVLDEQGLEVPFPIQAKAIPDGLAGRDVTGKAQTGSGKTLAFGIPIVAGLEKARPRHPTGLILVPTRELATQVTEALEPLLAVRGLREVAVYGGAPMAPQIKVLEGGADLVIATPGRLIDLTERGNVVLDDITVVAIDEADQMADLGFLPQVRKIMASIPRGHQTFLFSATLDLQVQSLIDAYLTDPVHIEVETAPEGIETMEHRFLTVHHMDKAKVVAAIAAGAGRSLVFTRTKHGADRLTKELTELGTKAAAIHGDLQQRVRERNLARFAEGQLPVLVATNVASRGLHIDGVDIVIHFDPPDDPKTYLHRSGRTARAGEEGLVVTLVEWDQVNEVLAIQRRAGLNVPIIKMFSNDDRLRDLTAWEPPAEMAPFKPGSVARRRRRRL
ncbi:MAG: DEAD/DEAH box helicase [Actinobacteria bacterium]|nr:MAG: DEAD/DEAH box helicase [Actinomycetota bacterium]